MPALITPNKVKGLNIDNNIILLSGDYIPTDTEILNRNIKIDFNVTPNVLFFHSDGTIYFRTDENTPGTFTWEERSLFEGFSEFLDGLKLNDLANVSPNFSNLQVPAYDASTQTFIASSIEGLNFSGGAKITDVQIESSENIFGYILQGVETYINIVFDQDINFTGTPTITVNYLNQDVVLNLFKNPYPGSNTLYTTILLSSSDISYESLRIVSTEIDVSNATITTVSNGIPANLQLNYTKVPNITINTFDFDLYSGAYGAATEKLLDINPEREDLLTLSEDLYISEIKSNTSVQHVATAPANINRPKLVRNYHAGYNAILFSGNQYLDFLADPANLSLTGSTNNNTLNKWTLVFVWQEIEGRDSYIFTKDTQYQIGFDNADFEPYVGNVEINGGDSAFMYRMGVFGVVTNGEENLFRSYLGTRFRIGTPSQERTANPGNSTTTRLPRLGASNLSNGNPRWQATGYLLRLLVYRGDLADADMINIMEEMKRIYRLN